MPSVSHLKHQAYQLSQSSTNSDVKALAEIVFYLARECEDIEKVANDAKKESHDAKREAKRAKG